MAYNKDKMQQRFGSVNRSSLHLNRAKRGKLSRTGQLCTGKIRAHGNHRK